MGINTVRVDGEEIEVFEMTTSEKVIRNNMLAMWWC